jgi:glutaminyl-peptide cyclotransferase
MMKKIIAVVLVVVFLAFIFFAGWNSCNQNSPKQSATSPAQQVENVNVPQFNADSAYYFTKKQVDFGFRIPGTPVQKKTADWLIAKMKTYTKNVYVQNTQVKIYTGKMVPCINIIGAFNPQAQKRILLLSHWDSRPYADEDTVDKDKPFPAACDGASGVAVLLEMARQFSLQSPSVGVDILLTDVEDYGPPRGSKIADDNFYCLGTQYWAEHPHVPNYSAYYGILLDMVGAKNAQFLQEGYTRQYAPEVMKKIWDTGNQIGYGQFFKYEDGVVITDDHYYVNKITNIPTVDIIDLDNNSPTYFAYYWHTHHDTMDIIDTNTLKAVGQTLLQVIYTEPANV